MPDPASIHAIHRTAQHQKLTWTRPGLPITLGPLNPAKYSVHCLDHSVPGTDQPCHPGAAAQSNWRLHFAKHRLPLRLRVLLAHMQPERIFVPDQYRLCQCYRRQVPKLQHTSHAEEQQVSDQHNTSGRRAGYDSSGPRLAWQLPIQQWVHGKSRSPNAQASAPPAIWAHLSFHVEQVSFVFSWIVFFVLQYFCKLYWSAKACSLLVCQQRYVIIRVNCKCKDLWPFLEAAPWFGIFVHYNCDLHVQPSGSTVALSLSVVSLQIWPVSDGWARGSEYKSASLNLKPWT